MKRPSYRITLHIDRVTVDRPGLDIDALDAALRQEVERALSADEAALWKGGFRPQVRATLPKDKRAPAARVASAAIVALRK